MSKIISMLVGIFILFHSYGQNTCVNASQITAATTLTINSTSTQNWAFFTATQTQHTIAVWLDADTLFVDLDTVRVYSGSCNSFVLLAQRIPSVGADHVFFDFSGLTIGTTYYINAKRKAPVGCPSCFPVTRALRLYQQTNVASCTDMIINGSFEQNTALPACATSGPVFPPYAIHNAVNWKNPLNPLSSNNNYTLSADYFHTSSGTLTACLNIPPSPRTGQAHGGMVFGAANNANYNEHILSMGTNAPVIAGRSYKLTFYHKRYSGNTPFTPGIYYSNTYQVVSGTGGTFTPSFITPIAGGWNKVDCYITPNFTGTLFFGITALNPTPSLSSNYWFVDDVSMVESAAILSVQNSSFCVPGNIFQNYTASGLTSYTWSISPNTASIIPNGSSCMLNSISAAGTYTLTVSGTTPGGCPSTEQFVINALPRPTVSITPANAVLSCAGNTPTLTATFSPANVTFQWCQSPNPNTQGSVLISGANTASYIPTTNGYYYVVVTNPLNGCTAFSNIVQVTVYPSPVAGILGVVDEQCSAANNGTILAGATGGTQPYSYAWSTNPVQTTAGANNLNAGTYTVTVTDANGCTSSAQATVVTSPPLAAPVVTSDAVNGILCQSQLVTYTVTNYDLNLQYSYTTNLPPVSVNQLTADSWEVDWGGTCQNVRFTVTASNGTVACDVSTMLEIGACCPCTPNATDAIMGGYPGSQTVFDLYNTYNSTGIITNPSPGVYDYNNPNGTLYINGAFLVPNAITLNIINSDVQFGSGASIVVPGTTNSRLNVTGSHLHAGCNDMWDGMRVTGGGEITVNGSLIEDAEKAVYSATGAVITLTDAVFNKNYIGVEYDTYSGDHPGVMTNTVFTCRQLPVGANVALLKGAQTFTDFIQEYPVTNYTGTTLLNPRSGQRSYAGVYVRNNGSAVVSPSTAFVTSFTAARIGTSTGYNDLNVFDYLDYGVYAYYSNVIVENNAFQYITSPQIINPNTPNTGAGVYGVTFSEPGDVWVMRVGGIAGGQTNTFWNCGRGVDLNGYYDTEVSSNLFHSAQVYSPTSITPGYGAYGIFLKSGNSRRTDVQFNEVVNVRNGIALFADAIPASSGQYYKFIGLGTISNNRIAEQPSFGAPVTGAYVQVGMVIQNVIPACTNCLTEITTDRLYVENNVFEQVFNGIRLLNWNKYPRVADNQIGLKYLAPSAAQQNPQQGIRVINTLTAVVYRNTIIGDAQCLTKTNVRGIYASRSASGIWRCNYVQNVGQCLVFEGNCGAGTVFNNYMYDAQDGLVLLNNGIIGAQGSLPSSTSMGAVCDNFWFGPFSHADTYTDQTFVPDTHSPLYIRNTAAPGYIPQVNLTTGFPNTDSYNAPGAIILTNVLSPDWDCNEPAPIAEQGGGEKAQQVKLMEQIVQDELELSGYVAAGQWMDKKEAYGKLMADSSLMDTSAVLQNFYADAPAQSYGKVAEVNDLAATSNLNVVQTAGSALPENTDAEFNHKQVVLLFTKQMEGQTLDSNEVVLLEQIARTCPLYGGTAVYQAQALLCLVKDEVILFEEDCFVPVNNNRKPRTPKTTTAAPELATVYPNPATTQLTVSLESGESTQVVVELRDLTGRVVSNQQLNINNGTGVIDLNTLAQGSYIIHITQGDKAILNQLVVIKK
jgi:hypothetical protein